MRSEDLSSPDWRVQGVTVHICCISARSCWRSLSRTCACRMYCLGVILLYYSSVFSMGGWQALNASPSGTTPHTLELCWTAATALSQLLNLRCIALAALCGTLDNCSLLVCWWTCRQACVLCEAMVVGKGPRLLLVACRVQIGQQDYSAAAVFKSIAPVAVLAVAPGQGPVCAQHLSLYSFATLMLRACKDV